MRGPPPGLRTRPAVALIALLALALLPVAGPLRLTPAAAAPTITIKAHTEVRLRGVRRRDDAQVAVTGQLVDRATGTGVGGQIIVATIGGRTLALETAPDGTFEATVPVPAGSPTPLDVALEFAGDGSYDPARLEERGVDATRAPVDLTITVAVTGDGAVVTVEATADGERALLPVTLRVSADDTDEPHRELPATTGQPLQLRRADVFGPGVKRLRARFAGDPGRSAATAETTVELTSATRIDLALAAGEVGFEDTIQARGRVVDEDGAGVPRAAVALTAGPRRLGAVTTGDDGRWRIDVSAELLGAGRHTLQAVAETRERWRTPSRSAPATVTIGVPRPAPVALTLAAFAATALVAVGFVLARRRPWQRPAAPAPAAAVAPEPRGGLEPGRASLVSTLRRASDHGFAGQVRDAVRNRPLAGAEVLLSTPATVRHVTTDDQGNFVLEELAPAEWTARVAAPGHITEHFAVTIPHRGELRGARIDLVPVREKVFALYRRAALPHLPSPELWGIWSPRQIVDHVRARRPPEALADLTGFIEEAYFSARTPDEGILPTAESKVAAALAERG